MAECVESRGLGPGSVLVCLGSVVPLPSVDQREHKRTGASATALGEHHPLFTDFLGFLFFIGVQPWPGEGRECEQCPGTWGPWCQVLPAGLDPEHVAVPYELSRASAALLPAQHNHSG